MRLALFGGIIAAALALSACDSAGSLNPPVSNGSTPASPAEPGDRPLTLPMPDGTAATAVSGDPTRCGLASGTLVDERALYAAETAYNVPANTYVTFDTAGKLPASVKAVARPALVKAYAALKLARSAYAAGDVCGLKAYAETATSFANNAKALLPGN